MADQLINIKDPDSGELVGSVPQSQLQGVLSQGYQQATPQETEQHFNEQEYGTAPQQLATFAEHAGSAATFGTSPELEFASGITTPEAYRKRTETNTIAAPLGETVGLVGSAFVPGGEGALLERAGQAGVNALGLGGEGLLAKVGSSAVKNAIEAGLYQAGDENAKLLTKDPNENAQTAIAHVGLGALYGGALGGVLGSASPLWKSTMGDRLNGLLELVQKRANGEPIALAPEVRGAMESAGIQVPDAIKAGLSDNPSLQRDFNILQESKTDPGLSLKSEISNFTKNATDEMARVLGKDPESIIPSSEISKYEVGKNIGKSLADEFQDQIGPTIERFEQRKAQFGSIPISPELKNQMAEKLGQLAIDQGWTASPSSDIMREFNRTIKELPLQNSLKDLTNYQTAIGNNTADFTNPSLTRAGSLMKKVLRETESDLMTKATEATGLPDAVQTLSRDRQIYSGANDLRDELNQTLHVKGGNSVGSFINNLRDMSQSDGETVLKRLTSDGDADLLQNLQQNFPKTAQLVKDHILNDIIGTAAQKAKGDLNLNRASLIGKLFGEGNSKGLSPEMKKFILPEGAEQKLKGLNNVLEYIPKNKSSGTPGGTDALWSKVPGAALGIAAMLTGHNPALGFLIGQAGRWVSRDAPDALRLAFLKFLGSEGEVNPAGFKAAVDFIHHTIQGENLTSKAVNSLFEAGKIQIPDSRIPNDKSREKLDKQLQDIQANPQELIDTGSQVVHYMPEHGQALAQTAAQGATYLNSIRPKNQKQNPLDEDADLNQIQKDKFNRALDIAHQPLMILQHIKDGEITPDDVINLRSIYPNFYNNISQKIMGSMTDAISDKKEVPYETRLGLSLFLGQPLDSTITPQAINAAQPMPQAPMPQQGSQQKGPHSMKNIGKMAMSEQTPGQARESKRISQS